MYSNPQKNSVPANTVNGMLLVDKPATWTSFDVVNFVRSKFNIPKVGHCGTLDPAATGLLVLLLGKYTTYCEKLSGMDKRYLATIQIGIETDSYDLDGKTISQSDTSSISNEQLKKTILSFVGTRQQVPPMVSAKKINGRKLCDLARRGITVDRCPREITISNITILECRSPFCQFVVDCSKGTYIRSLCHDIGSLLGCGGTLSSLRRLKSGELNVNNAMTIESLKAITKDQLANSVCEMTTKFLPEISDDFNKNNF